MAIAAWASRTWAFDSANFLPPLQPRALAALSPARVRSRISVSGWPGLALPDGAAPASGFCSRR